MELRTRQVAERPRLNPYDVYHHYITRFSLTPGCRYIYVYICIYVLCHTYTRMTEDRMIELVESVVIPRIMTQATPGSSFTYFHPRLQTVFGTQAAVDSIVITPGYVDTGFREPTLYMMALAKDCGYGNGTDAVAALGAKLITHYFAIVNRDGHLFMISSWGSDRICIEQYETQIVRDEFKSFIRGLASEDMVHREALIPPFMRKYFLNCERGIARTISMDEDDLGDIPRVIDNPSGTRREITSILGDTSYRMVYLPDVYGIFRDFVISLGITGGSRRKKHKTRRSRRRL